MTTAIKTCMNQNCDQKVTGRGLCKRHYNVLRQGVLSGKMTWEELIVKGLCRTSKAKLPVTPETREKLRIVMTGRTKITAAGRDSLRLFNTGRTPSPETVEKIRIAKTGHVQPAEEVERRSAANRGKKRSVEVCDKISRTRADRARLDHEKLIAQHGEDYFLYPVGWNRRLRKSIRQRDDHKCQLCGCPQTECEHKLAVHHIDYHKKNLDPVNLISLCWGCHGRVHTNRQFWLLFFHQKMVQLELTLDADRKASQMTHFQQRAASAR